MGAEALPLVIQIVASALPSHRPAAEDVCVDTEARDAWCGIYELMSCSGARAGPGPRDGGVRRGADLGSLHLFQLAAFRQYRASGGTWRAGQAGGASAGGVLRADGASRLGDVAQRDDCEWRMTGETAVGRVRMKGFSAPRSGAADATAL